MDEAKAPPRPGLAVQDLSKLDVNELNALSPEVISRQATINIGARARSRASALPACEPTVPRGARRKQRQV